MPGDVAEHDRQTAVGQLQEVVHVAADVDAGSGLVHAPDLEAGHRRELARVLPGSGVVTKFWCSLSDSEADCLKRGRL